MSERKAAPATIRRNVLDAIKKSGKKSVNGLAKILPHNHQELHWEIKNLQRRGLLERKGGSFRLTDEGKKEAPK